MEVKINREIRNYTEAMFFGLSLRQFIFLPVPAWWRWVSISCSNPMSARKPYRGCAFWEPHPLRLLASLNTTE